MTGDWVEDLPFDEAVKRVHRLDKLEDLRGARNRLAWAHSFRALAIAKTLERDPDATVDIESGLACVAAWDAFCKADGEYRRIKKEIEE